MSSPAMLAEPFMPRSPEYLADPYAQLKQLREFGPCVIDPGSGKWFFTHYPHVSTGLSQIVRGHKESMREVHFPANPFAADGPGHTGPRRVIAPTFTNRAVQKFRERAQRVVDDALAGKERGGEFRVVDEIGFLLPYTLTCDLLGVPDVDNRLELKQWTWQSLELIDAFLTPEQLQSNLAAAGNLAAHLRDVIEWRRANLDDGMLSMVIRAADEGDVMRPEQVISYIHTLYLAGMHTTVNQIALSLLALLNHRDQWNLLCADGALFENAVEELLRYESTAQYMQRTTEVDTDIEGVFVPAGTEVVCWIASADRDEARFGATADRLDITRADARQHVAFGFGPHVCIGSWLARLELQVVLSTIIERFPTRSCPSKTSCGRATSSEAPKSWCSNCDPDYHFIGLGPPPLTGMSWPLT